MNNEGDNAGDGFEQRAGAALRDSVGQLDARTRSRLTGARHAALEQARAATRFHWRSWAPAGALALALLVTLLYLRPPAVPAPPPGPVAALDDLELLGDAEALELNVGPNGDTADYDFYEWAAAVASGRSGI